MRHDDSYDEIITIETIYPNGQIKNENFNWKKGQNCLYSKLQNVNIPGNMKLRIFDKSKNLLAEKSVAIKPNPNQQNSITSTNISERIDNANFNNPAIQSLLQNIVMAKNQSDNSTTRAEKQQWWNQVFIHRDLSVDQLNMYGQQSYGLLEYYMNDIKLAEGFLKEL